MRLASGWALGSLRPWLSLAMVCAGFSLSPAFREVFWTAEYLPAILQQAATNIILAVGMTFVILSAGIDLSVGSVLALCGVSVGIAVRDGLPWHLAVVAGLAPAALLSALLPRGATARARVAAFAAAAALFAWMIGRGTAGGIRLEGALGIALLIGCGCGLINGAVATLGRVPPFIVTLGMLTAARGITLYTTGGQSVPVPQRMGVFGEGGAVALIALAVVGAGSVLLNRTRAGRYVRAIGGSEESSRLSGVDVPRFATMAYVLSGLCAAVAAIVLTAKFRVADTGAGTGAELNAIAACVIGGASLSGGRGSVIGSLVGALTIAVLNAGLVIIRVPDTLQGVVIGAVIVTTVMIDQWRLGRMRPVTETGR